MFELTTYIYLRRRILQININILTSGNLKYLNILHCRSLKKLMDVKGDGYLISRKAEKTG